MAADVQHRPSGAGGFHERLASLGWEFERLDAENRSLRAQLSALAGAAGRDGLEAVSLEPAGAPDVLAEVDCELAPRTLEFQREQVHMMGPSTTRTTSHSTLTVFPASPTPTQMMPQPPRMQASSPLPPDDDPRRSSVKAASLSMVVPGTPGSGGMHNGPVIGWMMSNSSAEKEASPLSPSVTLTGHRLSNDLPGHRFSNDLPGHRLSNDKNSVSSNSIGINSSTPKLSVPKASTHGEISFQKAASMASSAGRSSYFRRSITDMFFQDSDGAPTREQLFESEVHRKPLFANASDMKEKVRQQLTKAPYSVADFYKPEGRWQAIAKSYIFEHFTLLVIGVNAIWIAIDADYNNSEVLVDAHAVFQVAENFFCTYFTLELFVRFMAFEHKRNCVKDAWFVFDLLLVTLYISETWVMSMIFLVGSGSSFSADGLSNTSILRVFRLVRLVRMARMAKILRAVPELMIMVKGVQSASRGVSCMLAFLAVVLYVFAVCFQQLLKGTDVGKRYFGSVPEGMHTLWIKGALLDDISQLMDDIQRESVAMMLLLDVFLLIATLTVMNMLIGVLCEVVNSLAAAEREDVAIKFAKTRLQRIFDDVLDVDGNQNISKEEFVKIIENHEACRTMHDLDVDVVSLVDFADVIFQKDLNDETYARELTFPEFMEVIIAFRGSNTATVKDIENLRKLICTTIMRCENKVSRVEALVQTEARRTRVSERYGGYGGGGGYESGRARLADESGRTRFSEAAGKRDSVSSGISSVLASTPNPSPNPSPHPPFYLPEDRS